MSAETNIKTVQLMYEAFGRGDVGALLDRLTDDIDWGGEAAGTGAPWYGAHRGPEEVAKFFSDFGSTMEVDEFTPLTFAGTDNEVLTVVRFRGRSRATGKGVSMNLHHYFRFRDGKVEYYRGTEDTAQTEAALRG